jgi:uncharacterized protein with HEPN domain
MKVDKLYLDQILDSIRKIESYTSGYGKGEFIEDEKTQSAVILQLTLIGEISKKISEETKKIINLPWKQIIGFRDRAIHNYFEVNLNIVWDTITDDLPVLKTGLQKFF